MKAPMTAAEAFETTNATVKETFETADILVSAGAHAKIISRFFEKFGVDTPEDEDLKNSAERVYHNAQKEYIKLFADGDDEKTELEVQVEFYELTEKAVESSYKICGIFRNHKIPMYEKRFCE